MCLTKSDMSDLLLKQNGCGVKVISTTGESSFFFYEDLDGTKGIDRAKYVHQNAHVIFLQISGRSNMPLQSTWIIINN